MNVVDTTVAISKQALIGFNNQHREASPTHVMLSAGAEALSEAKGKHLWLDGRRCFAALSMTGPEPLGLPILVGKIHKSAMGAMNRPLLGNTKDRHTGA